MPTTVVDNRRQYERYDMRFPAVLKNAGEKAYHISTRNISAGGAFFYTEALFEAGSTVSVEIRLENDTLKKLTGFGSCMKATGRVVRSDKDGLAVRFSGHKISPLAGTADS